MWVWLGLLQKWEAEARRVKTRYLEQMKEYQRLAKFLEKPAAKSHPASHLLRGEYMVRNMLEPHPPKL